ncbi:hypothetical protein D9M72_348540 [compost metagenome]
MRAGNQRPVDGGDQPAEILDIVEGERAIGEVEALFGQFELIEIGDPVVDLRIGRIGPGAGDHFFREIEAEHLGRTSLAGITREPAEAATEIDDAFSRQIRQLGANRRPFGSARKAMHRASELAVAFEEFRLVVNVLGHIGLLRGNGQERGRLPRAIGRAGIVCRYLGNSMPARILLETSGISKC